MQHMWRRLQRKGKHLRLQLSHSITGAAKSYLLDRRANGLVCPAAVWRWAGLPSIPKGSTFGLFLPQAEQNSCAV